jgi:CheY-like chemotaxis protein
MGEAEQQHLLATQEPNNRALYALSVFLSAFLLFQVQPLIAKEILPWFGGSAGVWTTCVLFFQLLLLGGYAYAHWLSTTRHRWIHMVVLVASVLMFRIIPADGWRPLDGSDPVGRILCLRLAPTRDRSPRYRSPFATGTSNRGHVEAAQCLARHHVTPVASLSEALQHIQKGHGVDLLITDYHLSDGETGTQVIATLREILGISLKAVLTTGDTSSAIKQLPRDPNLRITSKPIQAEELLTMLRALLAA